MKKSLEDEIDEIVETEIDFVRKCPKIFTWKHLSNSGFPSFEIELGIFEDGTHGSSSFLQGGKCLQANFPRKVHFLCRTTLNPGSK